MSFVGDMPRAVRRSADVSVGERKQDADQGYAVRYRVMDARDNRRSALVVLDDVELPQRMQRVERRRGEVGDESLQLSLVGGARQTDEFDVPGDVELRIVAPPSTGRSRFRPLPKSRKGQQPVGENVFEPGHVDWLRQDQDPHNDHEVGRPAHAQPGRIDGGHTFAI